MDEGRDSIVATGLGVLVALACLAGVALLLASPQVVVQWMDPDQAAAVPDLRIAAGSLLAAAGLTAIAARSGRRAGGLAILIGGALITTSTGRLAALSPALPALASVGTGLAPALVLVFAAHSVGPIGRAGRRVADGLAVVAACLVLTQFLAYDRWFDPACTHACFHDAPLLALPAAGRLVLTNTIDVSTVVTGCAAAFFAVVSLVGGSRGQSPGFLAFGSLLAATAEAGAAALKVLHVPMSSSTVGGTLAGIGSAAEIGGAVLISGGLLWRVVAVIVLRAQLERLSGDVASAAAGVSVQAGLQTALRDPTLRVGYAVPDRPDIVDADGAPLALDGTAGQMTTTLERGGRPVAVITHQRRIESDAVISMIDGSLFVAIDNERLQALTLDNLRTLRESRSRIVSIADEERRRIERDLHDGAQQRVLAIAFEVRLARSQSERDGDEARAGRFAAAEQLALAALDELRRIARGVHPAILSQSGLGPALSSLAEDTGIPMTLEIDRTLRAPQPVESTAYQIVAEAVTDAELALAPDVAVTIRSSGQNLIVEIAFNAWIEPPWPARLRDRVGALGGELGVEGIPGAATRLRAVMPCA